MTYRIPISTDKPCQSNQSQSPTNRQKSESQSHLHGIQPLTQQETAKNNATALLVDPRLPSENGNKRVPKITLYSRGLVPVPEHLRKKGENEKTLIHQYNLDYREKCFKKALSLEQQSAIDPLPINTHVGFSSELTAELIPLHGQGEQVNIEPLTINADPEYSKKWISEFIKEFGNYVKPK